MGDFEVHPIGTGQLVADLSDQVADLRAALATLCNNVRTFADDASLKRHAGALKHAAAVLDR